MQLKQEGHLSDREREMLLLLVLASTVDMSQRARGVAHGLRNMAEVWE